MTGINASMPSNFSTLQQAAKAAGEDRAEIFTSLAGSSNALLFMILPFPSLILCSTDTEANTFYSDAVFWSKIFKTEQPILIPPSGESNRLKSLSNLYALNPDKIITTVDSSLLPVWNRDAFPLQNISKEMSVNRTDFTRNMYNQGYHKVQVVTGEGEISVRGGIIDIFSPDNANPARIEFFGDNIESIRYFDIATQLSINEIDNVQISPALEPNDGPNLLDLLAERKIVLNEPDDIKRLKPDFIRTYNELKLLYFTSLPLENEGFNCSIKSAAGFGLLRNERQSIEGFAAEVKKLKSNFNIMMVCISKGQAKRLQDLFDDQDIHVPVLNCSDTSEHSYKALITLGELSNGFSYLDSIVLSDRDIFGQRPAYKATKKSKVSKLISSLEDFKEGDYIVHIDHGIGKFLGIKKEKIEDSESDFITIEYLGGDKLFVPLDRINYVQRFNAPENVRPKIDKLGGKTWQRTKKRVKQKIKDMAEKLIKIYAKRTTSSGNAFSDDTELHREFDGFFPYEETPDQLSSIDEIKRDMERTIPMDRLLCGDVGYGKTEVVMRACFKSVYDSKQVAVLVPTTILAEQHFETFTARFSAFPVKVDFLSRFKSRTEQKQTINELAEGQIDIIIGTHSLLGKNLKFSNLGLLVIDEEHKFGVTHKEKIKALKSNVDVITLSATPIPRTLHMALSGIRGMSTIETPPEDRLAVTSIVAR
jgi:transcription-repair coupling factor (superfamily II helicase)